MNKIIMSARIQLFLLVIGLILLELPFSALLFAGNQPTANPDGSSVIINIVGTKVIQNSDGSISK